MGLGNELWFWSLRSIFGFSLLDGSLFFLGLLFSLFLGLSFGFGNGGQLGLRLTATLLWSRLNGFLGGCFFNRSRLGNGFWLLGKILEERYRLCGSLVLLQVEILAVLSVDGIHPVGIFFGDSGALALSAHGVFAGIIDGLSLDDVVDNVFHTCTRFNRNIQFLGNVFQFGDTL